LYTDSQLYQWNRVEDPEMNPHPYGHLNFDKEAKTIQKTNKQTNNNNKKNQTNKQKRIDPKIIPTS
jgi:hypothetical protein